MNDPLFIRAHDRLLSLWQSAVAETARNEALAQNSPVSALMLDHPLCKATTAYVAILEKNPAFDPHYLDLTEANQRAIFLSHLGWQIGNALAEEDEDRAEMLTIEYRKFSDKDPGFLHCAATYAKYAALSHGKMEYHDWTHQGANNLAYGVIKYQLPNDAKVGILGDWGTGLDDAKRLLRDMLVRHDLAAILHLGDIYYSGTPKECELAFAKIFTEVFDEVLGKGRRIPVFTIPGNHDYYAWGMGFYPMLKNLNHNEDMEQEASYFCLRTQDGGWQFLAMDTGYYDSNPADAVDPSYAGPWLHPSEVQWMQDKMKHFGGATILLSHHQLFSANARINGRASTYRDLPYFNPSLFGNFSEWFPDKIGAWLWGHEHNLVLFQNNLFGLSKGRLIGCSAYEELTANNPYVVNYPQVPYLVPAYGPYELGVNTDPNGVSYYNHGYAVIDLGGRQQPTDAVEISYYQYPSWGQTRPANPVASLLFREQITMPKAGPSRVVNSGDKIFLRDQEGLFVSPLYSHVHNYPVLNTQGPVALRLEKNGGGVLNHGDIVTIRTTEPAAGEQDLLGAWSTPSLYYYKPGYEQEKWIIQKKYPGAGHAIQYGEEVYFASLYYNGHSLCSHHSKMHSHIYLTTRKNDHLWQIYQGH